jgi:hypothetical protein
MNFADLLKIIGQLSGDDYKEIAGIIHDAVALAERVKKFTDAHPDLFKPQA